jgi:hypothetical protein
MRQKKRLMAVAALAVAGVGWLHWSLSPDPAARYAFEFEAIVETEWISFRSIVGCYPFEVEVLEHRSTAYGLRERVFAKQLKSGNTFYVAVPNACAYARTASGEYLSKGDWERPSLEGGRTVTPLTYKTGGRTLETVRLFTSLASPDKPDDRPMIMKSFIRPLDEADDRLRERTGELDPLVRSDGWSSVVLVPVSNAPLLEQGWIEQRWPAGACEVVRLSAQGRTAVEALEPGVRLLEHFWPELWQGVPLTDITLRWNLDETHAAAVEDVLNRLIPAVPTAQGFEIRPDLPGRVELFHANSERQRMSARASAYVFNGVQLSPDGDGDSLPFAIQCPAERRLYLPAQLTFHRMRPIRT